MSDFIERKKVSKTKNSKTIKNNEEEGIEVSDEEEEKYSESELIEALK